MQQSDEGNRKAFVLNCYLDDSGTEPESAVVVIGGFLLDRSSFTRLSQRKHGIDFLHMRDFVRPHGRFIGKYQELKVALFTEAVEIINSRKTYSISVHLSNAAYKNAFEEGPFRKALGPYTVAFTGAAQLNKVAAERNKWPDRVAYVLDSGSPVAEQIRLGHTFMRIRERVSPPEITGPLTFDSDDNNVALQAADLIAWTCRRKLSGDGLKDESSPLLRIFEQRFGRDGNIVRPHLEYAIPPKSLSEMRVMAQDVTGGVAEINDLLRKAGAPESTLLVVAKDERKSKKQRDAIPSKQ